MSCEVEFDCEGCGIRVVTFGRSSVPANQLCAVCDADAGRRASWMTTYLPPAQMMELRKSMGLLKLKDDA
jgi:hypothetical protein